MRGLLKLNQCIRSRQLFSSLQQRLGSKRSKSLTTVCSAQACVVIVVAATALVSAGLFVFRRFHFDLDISFALLCIISAPVCFSCTSLFIIELHAVLATRTALFRT